LKLYCPLLSPTKRGGGLIPESKGNRRVHKISGTETNLCNV